MVLYFYHVYAQYIIAHSDAPGQAATGCSKQMYILFYINGLKVIYHSICHQDIYLF